MARTNFENLRVYQLSEDLADKIWDIVLIWDNFAKDTVGKQDGSFRRFGWRKHCRRRRAREFSRQPAFL